jgi:enoyl-CoA hydratase
MRIERHGEVALLRMQSGKVNAIGLEFLDRLSGLIDELSAARAAVITADGNTFSAGLDLPAVVPLDRVAMRAFMQRFNAVMLRLFELPVPLVAAINGHAIAGGCIVSLLADLRISADRDLRIGLNETQLGVGLPAVVLEALRAQVPASSLSPIALEGRLFSPREALQLGLVHEVVPEGELLARALQRAAALAALPPEGVRQAKHSLRGETARRIRELDATEGERWLDGWFSPGTQERLRAVVAQLKRR